jgi:FkbM family methyltransferase
MPISGRAGRGGACAAVARPSVCDDQSTRVRAESRGLSRVLEAVLYPAFRRLDFRGKGRLRRRLPVPDEGERVVSFPGGVRLRLDLRESLQRDFLFGLYDRRELSLMRRFLEPGGDMVDVGAHVGMYAISAARHGRGRVLAFEPNPAARRQLEANVALNGVRVEISDAAVAGEAGEALLHVPETDDPSFSSLGAGRFAEGEPVRVPTTTLDAEVEERGLTPAFVKVDVEGAELGVLAGAERTLARRPVLLVEVSDATAGEVERLLAGWDAYEVRRGGLRRGLAGASGFFNALFVPPERWRR